jgi:hypothetical protein
MAITLNHTIVPARDKVAAARFFAGIFGLDFQEPSGHFAPVHVNETLTLLFGEDTSFDSHHYAFHVSDAEFDAILGRIKKAGFAFGSAPWRLDDGKLNDWGGGRPSSLLGRPMRAVEELGSTNDGTTTRGQRWRTCEGRNGKRLFIRTMSSASTTAFERATKAASLGRTPIRCKAGTAIFAGIPSGRPN